MIVVEMLSGLATKQVEVWTHAKTDGPTFDGRLVTIGSVRSGLESPEADEPSRASLVGWIELVDDRGLRIRVAGVAISAVVSRG